MVGKLQTNKVKHAIQLFDYIHSLDNKKLADKIAVEQKKINKKKKSSIFAIFLGSPGPLARCTLDHLHTLHDASIT